MPELKDVARVTRRGEDLPDLRDGSELQTNAWLLHEAARTEVAKAGSGAQPHEYNGIPGMRWVGSVNALMMDLWRPRLTNDADDTKSQTFKRQLNSYLAATENLVCVARSAAKSTWWVRDEWNPNAPQARAAVSQRSARVPAVASPEVPKPAGQSDVKVSFMCLWEGCEHVFPTEVSRAAHHFTSHRSARSYIAEALAGSEPVAVEVLQERLRGMGYPGSPEVTGRTLNNMRQSGLVRSHGVAGEEDETWSLAGVTPRTRAPEVKFEPPTVVLPGIDTAPVVQPEPAGQEGYRCREPGCTEPPFGDAGQRTRHEKDAHPDMSSRKYPCTYPGCTERFYATPPLSIHAARSHRVLRGTPEGEALLNAAIAAAEGKVTPAPQETPIPEPAPAAEPLEGAAPPTGYGDQPEIDARLRKSAPAPTPLKEDGDALDAVAALVEEVRQRRAEKAELESLRQMNADLRDENTDLRDRVSRMRRMVEEW